MLLYTLIQKGSALKSLNFYPSGISNIRFDGATPIMSLTLIAQNTSNQFLNLNSLAATLSANGYQVGNISSFTPQRIMPNSQASLLVEVRLGLLGIVNDIIRDVQYGNFTQDLKFEGTANVDNYQIPLDMTFKAGA